VARSADQNHRQLSPGGSADIGIRALQPLLAEDFRQPIGRLNAAFVKALSDPAAAAEKIRVLGAEPAPSSAEAFAQFIGSEGAKWGKLISDAGIKSE
jgi:tripartite-type tricarboxylate transporter receptor subunit TctC